VEQNAKAKVLLKRIAKVII